jgi:hypothetical protein
MKPLLLCEAYALLLYFFACKKTDAIPAYQEGGLLNARFNQPNGIGIDDNDYLYISDMGNRRIRKITPY